ncbi:MAG TPA: DUF3857 domain-containing protein, partial [Flavobacteriales bacterium]|nr:DUF3857 domain-containing protein [Flavobacteriales bacterium]
FSLLISLSIWSQNYKFGKVSKKELKETSYSLDKDAPAAILYKKRDSKIEITGDGGFLMTEDYYVRLKIYNKEGFDYATVEIPYYSNGNLTQRVTGIKGVTYNLSDGKMVKTKLKSSNIYTTRSNQFYKKISFTLPNIKPGSIIEWKYTITSPSAFIRSIDEFTLQHSIPIKKLYASFATSVYLRYAQKTKGYRDVHVRNEKKQINQNYVSFTKSAFTSDSSQGSMFYDQDKRIIDLTNVPAIKDEPFSGNIDNYTSGIIFELAAIHLPYEAPKNFTTDWESVTKTIYKNDNFGKQIKKQDYLKDDIKNLIGTETDVNKKINKILAFAKKKVKWDGFYGKYIDKGVKKAYKNGKGNVAEVNLNLVNMLKSTGLKAYPVLVSTLSHGIAIFPSISNFNYVIAGVKTDNKTILLDATSKYSMPDVLPERDLNFQGRLVKEDGTSEWVDLYPTEPSVTNYVINAKIEDDLITGMTRKIINNYYAMHFRENTVGKNADDLLKWIDNDEPDIDVTRARVTNLNSDSKIIKLYYQFDTESFMEEIGNKLYISPLLYQQLKENPFKSETRNFPIFFNYPKTSISNVTLQIPGGYQVESLPKDKEIILEDNMGNFSYKIVNEGNNIKLSVTFAINQPVILANNYTKLKDFFRQVIEKEAEKVILIKK